MSLPRALLFNALFYPWTLVLMLAALPVRRQAPLRRIVHFWASSSLALLRGIVGLDHRVGGLRELPPAPFLIAAKHQSAWDILSLTLLFPDAAFVLKRELARLPLFGRLATRAGHIAVDRKGRAAALSGMVHAARQAAAAGRPILVFPQGTRTAPGERRPYLVGVAALYAELQLPVVPIALNSGSFWPRRRPRQRPGTITVSLCPAIPPGLDRHEFLARLAETIEAETARIEAAAGH